MGPRAATGDLESENQRLVRALGERVKELRALHQAAELLRRGDFSTGELLARVAALLPPAFQYPEVSAAAVEFCELVRATPGFRDGAEELQAAFVTRDGRAGRIRVVYLESRPGLAAGPFLDEETSLLETLAEMLRGHFEQCAAAETREAARQRQERQHDALVRLTRSPAWHRADSAGLHEITETVAAALAVARVSYWRRAEDGSQIECEDLFETAAARHTRGAVLPATDYPAYFAALATEEVIDAADARRDPRTREFAAGYLEPLDIHAMLDTPVRVGGRLAGVLCLEHTGGSRRWTPDERSFAVAAASLWSLALAQSALARSEGRLRTILESEPECVKVVSLQGELLDINPAGLRMIEAARWEDVAGLPVLNLIHPDDHRAFGELHRRVCGGETGRLQFRVTGLRGTERWMETHSTPLREPDGGIRAVLSVTRDITERRRAEQAAREAQLFNERLIEHSPLAIVTYRPTGEGVTANVASARLLGAPDAAAVAARNFRQLPLWRESGLLAAAEATLADGRSREQEVRGVNSFGRDTWLHCRLVPFDFGGERYLLGFFDDIRERKQAEETMRQQQALLRIAGQVARLGGWAVELPDHRVIWSEEMHDILEIPRDQIPSLAEGLALYPEPWRGQITAAVATCERTGEPFDLEAEIHTASGRLLWVRVSGEAERDPAGAVRRLHGSFQDVTATHRAGDALRASEERFREMADNIGDIFYNYDPVHDRLLYANRAYERIWGRPLEYAYAHPTAYLEYIVAEDRPRAEAAFARQLKGEATIVEFRITRPDGGRRWIQENAVPVRDAAGRVERIVGTMRDITDTKQGELALRDSEERYALAVRASQAALWDWNMSTDVIVYSPRYREMLGGYTRAEFPDTLGAFFSKVHPDDLEAVKQAVRGQVERHQPAPHAVEFRLLTRQGEYRWFRASAQAEWDASGRPIRMVGSTVDIHERRLAEAKVREQAELLDKAQDAILVRDLEHRIQYWNKSAERLYGWSAAEAVGRSVKELLYQNPTEFLKATAATLKQGEWVGELTQFNKAGQPLTVEGRWTLVSDGQGQPKSILAINTDISERKRIEQQLLRTQRMESLGTLAGGIAHDLNNVLAPILVSIEFLRLDERDPERLMVLSSLEDSARRGADLVRQVLSFARGIEGERVLTNLQHLARELQQIVRDTFPKNIEFRLESARDLRAVSADPTQMHQVMMNLCVNARDAMPEGGRLTLALRNFEVDDIFAGMNPDARPGPYVIIKVEDTGTGIPANIQERIFDPFFTTKEFGKGTGLGLATVLSIVKSHGGFINLYSEPGKGTKFQVYLPAGATPESVEQPAVEATRLPRGRGELILVVDDEEGVRTVTQKTLERFGYRVMLAVHGADAVAVYARHGAGIAVVLTDMAMPVMDGPATILALKAMNPAVKIIGSSGHTSGDSIAKATGAGVGHFVPKPYTAETLLQVLAEVLDRPV